MTSYSTQMRHCTIISETICLDTNIVFFFISLCTQIARFTWPTWGPPGSCRPQVGPVWAARTLLSEYVCIALLSQVGTAQNSQRTDGVAPYRWITIRISAVVWYFVHRGIGKSWCHEIEVPMWQLRSPPLAWQPWYFHVRITCIRVVSECSSTCYVGGSHLVG